MVPDPDVPKPTARPGALTTAWFLLLPVLMLGPALWGRGYVLSYDMVWVPDLTLRPEMWGLGQGWPRAVPSDAVVAVLDEVLGGELLQKLVLYGALALAGLGGARLCLRTGAGRAGAVAGGTWLVWNPFVAERLVLGAWPVLLGLAALPWVVVGATRAHREGRVPPGLLGWVLLGSLSASAGLVTAAVALVLGLGRARRAGVTLVLAVLGANAPWVVTGLLHAGLTSDPAGVRAFAAHAEGGLPAPLATLTLGGIWNDAVVPGSRQGAVLPWVGLVVLVGLAAAGSRGWWHACDPRLRRGLVGSALVAWVVALVGWALPGPLALVVEALPPVALLRDGARYLAPLALLLAVLVAHGVAALARRAAEAGPVVVGAAVLAPLALLPDLAWGAFGTLRPVDYPASYAEARAALLRATGDRGRTVLVLPFSAYRAPAWNHRHPVLDPTGRALPQDYLASDELRVSGRPVAAEDPRVPRAEAALAQADPTLRAASLRALGVVYLVTETDVPGAVTVAGRTVVDTPLLRVQALGEGAQASSTSPARVVLVVLAWAAAAAVLLAALVGGAVAAVTSGRRRSA